MIDSILIYENVEFTDNLAFADSSNLQKIYKNISSSITKYHKSKLDICLNLYKLKEFFIKYEDNINISFNKGIATGLNGTYCYLKFCEEFFNLSSKSIYRYLQIYEKFFKDNFSVYHIDMLKQFDISKLAELLVLNNESILKGLNSGKLKAIMSRNDIRKFVKKEILAGENNLINAEDMFEEPEKFIPGKHYEKQYFNSLSKGELVNYIYELQTYCEKLKTKKTK